MESPSETSSESESGAADAYAERAVLPSDMNLCVIPHDFSPCSEPASLRCDVCCEAVLGEHARCVACRLVCHASCQSRVLAGCCGAGEHAGVRTPHALACCDERAFCWVCQAPCARPLRCVRCGAAAHRACRAALPQTCVPFASRAPHPTHFFARGGRGPCAVCGEPTASPDQLLHLVCVHCGRSAHTLCALRLGTRCDCGALGAHVVHPSDVDLRTRAVVPRAGLDPLVLVYNRASGGRASGGVAQRLRHLLHPLQLLDIAALDKTAPFYRLFPPRRLLVVVCGGDGSVCGCVDRFGCEARYAILPCGTGNDLARSLGADPAAALAAATRDPAAALARVLAGPFRKVDRWALLRLAPSSSSAADAAAPLPDALRHFTCYFSVGADAAVAGAFARGRGTGPAGVLVNRCRYVLSAAAALQDGARGVGAKVAVEVDGAPLAVGDACCLVFLSARTCYGGRRVCPAPQQMDDGALEVLAVADALHLAAVAAGVAQPRLVARGQDVLVSVRPGFVVPCQADGEPFALGPCTLHLYAEHQLDVGVF